MQLEAVYAEERGLDLDSEISCLSLESALINCVRLGKSLDLSEPCFLVGTGGRGRDANTC